MPSAFESKVRSNHTCAFDLSKRRTQSLRPVSRVTLIFRWKAVLFVSLAWSQSPILQVVLSTADSYSDSCFHHILSSLPSVLTKLVPRFHRARFRPQALSSLLLTDSVLAKFFFKSNSARDGHSESMLRFLKSTVWESPRPFNVGNLDREPVC